MDEKIFKNGYTNLIRRREQKIENNNLIETLKDTQEVEDEESVDETQILITKKEARDLLEQLKQFYYSSPAKR